MRKILSLVLTLAMLFSLCNIPVFAESEVVAKIGTTEYISIQAALEAAQADDTVTIFAGDYTGGLSVNKAITVVGETDAEGNNLVNISGKLSITADGASVKNININNGGDSAGYINAKNVLIEGCLVVGGNGFRWCYADGVTTFRDCTITGTTYGIHFDGNCNGEIVIDNCVITGWTSFASTITKVAISGTEFAKGNYNQLRFYQDAEISNTTFNPDMTVDFGKNEVEVVITNCSVSDGSPITDVIYLGDIAEMGVNVTVDGAPVVVEASVTTEGGEPTYYATLQDAVDAAQEDDIIVITNDFELDTIVTVANGKKITLDLNGKTITGTDNTEKNFSLIDNRGELTITGNGKMTLTAKIDSDWNRYSAVLANNPGGKLTIENGTFEHLGGTDMAYGIDNLTNGKGTYAETIINGGVVKSTYRGIRQFLNGIEAQNILTVNGGTVEGANKSIWMQDPSKNANTGTLTVGEGATLNGDVYLTVTEGSTEWPVEVSIAKSAVNGQVLTNGNEPEGYAITKNADGTYGVGVLPNAEVKNLGKTTVDVDSYYIYDLIGGSGLETGTEPFDLQVAMQFIAKDTPEEAANNAYGDYITDFYIQMDGIKDGSFVADGCYLAGYYPSFKAWVKIPLDNFTIENGKVYPVITSAGFNFTYEDICTSVQDFTCGIYFSEEVIAANPDMTVSLTLGLSETPEAAQAAEFITVDEPYTYAVADFKEEKLDTGVGVLRNYTPVDRSYGQAYKVKFFAGIESLKYEKVGYEFKVNGYDNVFKTETKTVYEKIDITTNSGVKTYEPTDFADDANYIFALNVYVPVEYGAAATLEVRAYAVPLDGEPIYSEWMTTKPIGQAQ